MQGMSENEKTSPLPPLPPASADMMNEGGGSVPLANETTTSSGVPSKEKRLPQAPRQSPASMTLLARIRRGWRSGAASADRLPVDRKSQFWTFTTLCVLFALSVYVVWSTLGFAD